jgi:hypothetical protein
MSTTHKQPDYSSLLKDIAEFYEDNAVEVCCPTFKQKLKFKPLNVRQLKSFMSLQVSYDSDDIGFDQGLNILKEINKILNENSLDDGVDINDTLTVLDRDMVILQLRASTNPIAEIDKGDDEIDKVDLAEVVDRIKGASLDKNLKSVSKVLKYNSGDITLTLQVPTLSRDACVNDYFASKLRTKIKTKKDFEKNASSIFAQVYFIELFKYIKSITFNKNDKDTVVDFHSNKNMVKHIDLLEQLPTKAMTEITSYVTDVKSFRDSVLHYVNKDGEQVPLDIDANIFIGI